MGGDSQEPEGGRSPLSLHNLATRRRPSRPLTFQRALTHNFALTQFKLAANKTTIDQTLSRRTEKDWRVKLTCANVLLSMGMCSWENIFCVPISC